jgi:hypothetical protein
MSQARRYLYDHGLPFSQILSQNIDGLIDRIEKKKAALMVVEGGLGEGKTTLSVHCANYICDHYGLPHIDLTDKKKPQMAMGGSDFLKKIRICYEQKLVVIIYDEAGDFSKRAALTQFNAMINRTFETFRAFKIIVIMCLPSFDVLDQQLLDKQIPRLMLRCYDRQETYGNFDGYSLYRMNLLKWRMGKMAIKNFAYTIIRPNFSGHFLDLDPEQCKLLDRLSTKNKLEMLRSAEVKIEGLMTYPEMALKLGKSVVWVRHAVGVFKLKPEREIGRLRYFNQETLARLSEYVNNRRYQNAE